MCHWFEMGEGFVYDSHGVNALMRAAVAGSKRIVKLCLRNGLDPNHAAFDGTTALHMMCEARPYAKQVELLEYLLSHGADPDVQDLEGRTPVYVAATCGRSDLIRVLMKDADGNLPVSMTSVVPEVLSAPHCFGHRPTQAKHHCMPRLQGTWCPPPVRCWKAA